MELKDLTRYQRRRLNQARECPVCHKEIMDYHRFAMFKRRHRRCMVYEFIHTHCLREYYPTLLMCSMQYIDGAKDGKEKYIPKDLCGNRKDI